jgi:hypothetical protein
MGFGGSQALSQSAKTLLCLATFLDISNTSGRYGEGEKGTDCRFSQDLPEAK